MTATLLWLRRDLRVHDHPALVSARGEGTVFALFVLDPLLLGAPTTGPRRVRFLLESLAELRRDLAARGIPLLIREGPPEVWVPEIARALGARSVHMSQDVTPYARRRDRRVARALAALGIELREHPGLLLTDPRTWPHGTQEGRLPSFSAFYRRYRGAVSGSPLPAPPAQERPSVEADPVPEPSRYGADVALDPSVTPGESAARERLERFARERLNGYTLARSSLDPDATSGLSQDLHFGLLSPREVRARCDAEPFVRQLYWREYAHYVVARRPGLRDHPYDEKFASLPWQRDRALFDRWRTGTTGFPLVDAAMRQLAASGRIANRLRMLTASFLTKHLLIDWRWGMSHFLRELVDGDVANNTFGWQWAASLGVDAAAPLRVFSPQRHLERFDPDGSFVRRWVRELADAPPLALRALPVMAEGYPAPVVDHREAATRARNMWSSQGRG
jgi:deoxyribodipyrimidine photo-lyase